MIQWKRLHSALDSVRKERGLSWRKLGREASLTPSSFTRISKDLPLSAENLMKVLALLHLEIKSFVK